MSEQDHVEQFRKLVEPTGVEQLGQMMVTTLLAVKMLSPEDYHTLLRTILPELVLFGLPFDEQIQFMRDSISTGALERFTAYGPYKE